jgi:hypothetical protein
MGFALGSLELRAKRSSGKLLYVWGYHPMAMWRRRSQAPGPPAEHAVVKAAVSPPPEPQGSIGLWRHAELDTTFDPTSGWVRIARRGADPGDRLIRFASESLAELGGSSLRALWLQPTFEP